MTIWCMRIACWIPKSTKTHAEYVTVIDGPLQHWVSRAPEFFILHTLTVVLRYS